MSAPPPVQHQALREQVAALSAKSARLATLAMNRNAEPFLEQLRTISANVRRCGVNSKRWADQRSAEMLRSPEGSAKPLGQPITWSKSTRRVEKLVSGIVEIS
jgi:hypothetical protein